MEEHSHFHPLLPIQVASGVTSISQDGWSLAAIIGIITGASAFMVGFVTAVSSYFRDQQQQKQLLDMKIHFAAAVVSHSQQGPAKPLRVQSECQWSPWACVSDMDCTIQAPWAVSQRFGMQMAVPYRLSVGHFKQRRLLEITKLWQSPTAESPDSGCTGCLSWYFNS